MSELPTYYDQMPEVHYINQPKYTISESDIPSSCRAMQLGGEIQDISQLLERKDPDHPLTKLIRFTHQRFPRFVIRDVVVLTLKGSDKPKKTLVLGSMFNIDGKVKLGLLGAYDQAGTVYVPQYAAVTFGKSELYEAFFSDKTEPIDMFGNKIE